MWIETAAEWAAKHGEYVLTGNEQQLFADGARRITSRVAPDQVQIFEPPSDPMERARLIVLFHETKLKRLVADFDHYRKLLLGQVAGVLVNRTRSEHLAHLDALKLGVDAEKAELASARQQLESLLEADPEEQLNRVRRQRIHDHLERARFHDEVCARQV